MSRTMVEGTVLRREILAPDVRLVEILAPTIAQIATAGQFVTVAVTSSTAPLLRRPLGIAAVDKKAGSITLIYRMLGEATQLLSSLAVGARVSVLGPLGQGFTKAFSAKHPLLVGGGLGLAPLLYLAQLLEGRAAVLMGGRTAQELYWQKLYQNLTAEIYLTTDDGSLGTKGNVNALLPQLLSTGKYDLVCVCGPVPMMRAVAGVVAEASLPCYVSLERYMCCGIGACLSCSCASSHGRVKVCTDGPVFDAREVVEW